MQVATKKQLHRQVQNDHGNSYTHYTKLQSHKTAQTHQT
jgi:hypothetical protein